MATFVLVHGAWGGAHGFTKVRRLLQGAGHEVFTPSLTGIGERAHLASPQICLTTHVADVANAVLYEDLNDIVLLGFSYGEMVITGALEHLAATRHALSGIGVGYQPARLCHRHAGALQLAASLLGRDGTRDAERAAYPVQLFIPHPVPLGQQISHGYADTNRDYHRHGPRDRHADQRRLGPRCADHVGRSATMTIRRWPAVSGSPSSP